MKKPKTLSSTDSTEKVEPAPPTVESKLISSRRSEAAVNYSGNVEILVGNRKLARSEPRQREQLSLSIDDTSSMSFDTKLRRWTKRVTKFVTEKSFLLQTLAALFILCVPGNLVVVHISNQAHLEYLASSNLSEESIRGPPLKVCTNTDVTREPVQSGSSKGPWSCGSEQTINMTEIMKKDSYDKYIKILGLMCNSTAHDQSEKENEQMSRELFFWFLLEGQQRVLNVLWNETNFDIQEAKPSLAELQNELCPSQHLLNEDQTFEGSVTKLEQRYDTREAFLVDVLKTLLCVHLNQDRYKKFFREDIQALERDKEELQHKFECFEIEHMYAELLSNIRAIHLISLLITGIFGLFGNTITIMVLRRQMVFIESTSNFKKLLLCLSIIDSLLITFYLIEEHTFDGGCFPQWYVNIFPWFLYPGKNFALSASIFMVVAISAERYKAICFPLRHRPPWWQYVTLVGAVALLQNFPRFLDHENIEIGDMVLFQASRVKENKSYILFRTLWEDILSISVLPFSALVYFNFMIYRKISASSDYRYLFVGKNNHSERKISTIGNSQPTTSSTFGQVALSSSNCIPLKPLGSSAAQGRSRMPMSKDMKDNGQGLSNLAETDASSNAAGSSDNGKLKRELSSRLSSPLSRSQSSRGSSSMLSENTSVASTAMYSNNNGATHRFPSTAKATVGYLSIEEATNENTVSSADSVSEKKSNKEVHDENYALRQLCSCRACTEFKKREKKHFSSNNGLATATNSMLTSSPVCRKRVCSVCLKRKDKCQVERAAALKNRKKKQFGIKRVLTGCCYCGCSVKSEKRWRSADDLRRELDETDHGTSDCFNHGCLVNIASELNIRHDDEIEAALNKRPDIFPSGFPLSPSDSLNKRTLHRYANGQLRIRKRRKKSTCILASIVSVFFACHILRFGMKLYLVSHPEMATHESLTECAERGRFHVPVLVYILLAVANFLIVVNSSVNFIIYCFVEKSFREEMVHLLKEIFKKVQEKRWALICHKADTSEAPTGCH